MIYTCTYDDANPGAEAGPRLNSIRGNQLPLSLHEEAADPHEQRETLMALSKVKGLGEASLKALLRAYPRLNEVWDASPKTLESLLQKASLKNPASVVGLIGPRRSELVAAAKRELESLSRQNVQFITPLDPAFPKQLRDIKDTPQWLFVQGDIGALSMSNLVAVVGTRKASSDGIWQAGLLTHWLVEQGFGIVSGLAEGIDQAAHQVALDHGIPTIGVLGTGIARYFPAGTVGLRQQMITEGGAIVTEYFPNDPYSKTHFIRRNRIQAGLSYATVPVEARASSGTAHTYRYARDFGRFTFGVTHSSHPSVTEIHELLQADGRPIFDLDSPESMEKLRMELQPALEGAIYRKPQKLLFRSLLREFDRVNNSYPLSAEDLEDLKTELTERWQSHQHDSQGGSPRS